MSDMAVIYVHQGSSWGATITPRSIQRVGVQEHEGGSWETIAATSNGYKAGVLHGATSPT